jgi:molecular chaperone DnaK (HSP70)
MLAIGIDLGTTNSVAAVGSPPRVLAGRNGEALTPSAVGLFAIFKDAPPEIVVGAEALANAARDPANTILSIKRLMGRLYGEKWQIYDELLDVEEVARHFSYAIAPPPPPGGEDYGVKVLLGGKPSSPVEVSALILGRLKADAEKVLAETVTHAVITVPAYFSDRQRDATVRAGREAGLQVLGVLDEPSAAALAFGAGKEDERHRILVYDLGGGTFDVSIIHMQNGQYVQIKTEGDTWLGGDDFDRKIIARLIACVRQEADVDPSGDRMFLARAKEEAEKAKKALSDRESVDLFLPLVRLPGLPRPLDVKMTLTRPEFEADIAGLVGRTIEKVRLALRKANLEARHISEVLLVGGSTAIPMVQQAVGEVFGAEKVRRHERPMECVALGAAIHAASFRLTEGPAGAGAKAGTRLRLRTTMPMGIAVLEGDNPDAFAVIVPEDTLFPLPEPIRRTFYATEENQTLIRVPVYEGFNPLASLNQLQGVVEFRLPAGLSAATPVEVGLNYDENRITTVEIRIVGKDLPPFKETVRRDRAPAGTLVGDWREELAPCVRAGKHFQDIYGEYMEPNDQRELRAAVEAAEQALAANDRARGDRAMRTLHHKLFGSGVASQLFMADHALMSLASPEDTQMLGQAVARLRLAWKEKKRAEIEAITRELKLKVAEVFARRSQGRDESREARRGLLGVYEDVVLSASRKKG